MPRAYDIPIAPTAITAQVDLWEIVAPADAVVEILSIELGQTTEVGDAQEEQLSILVKRGQTTSGSGGSSATPQPAEFGDAAFGGTAEILNTTKATAGTITTHRAPSWNVRAGYVYIWTPETPIKLSPSQRGTVELASTPADSITVCGTATVRETGG